MPCGLIGSVSHAVWVDWICQSCHMGLLLIFPVPYDSFSLHDSWLYSNLHENHLISMLYPPILMLVIHAVRMKPGLCKLRPSAGRRNTRNEPTWHVY